MRGKFLVKLNITARPIANKYREGKLKRTEKSELKVLEIDKVEQLAGREGRRRDWFEVSACGRGRVRSWP